MIYRKWFELIKKFFINTKVLKNGGFKKNFLNLSKIGNFNRKAIRVKINKTFKKELKNKKIMFLSVTNNYKIFRQLILK